MIKALRIDHRLVHGQVAFTWTHFLGATRIIVIDDKAAGDDFQKMALNMAKPAGVKELNLGGIAKKDGSKNYGEVVYLTPEEEEDLRKIKATGCQLFMQQLPTTKRESLDL